MRLLVRPQPRIFNRIHWPIVRTGAAIVVSALLCVVLAWIGLAHGISDAMISLGFDSDRALLLQYMLMALVGGLVAGAALRQSLASWLGAWLYYIVGYLIPYLLQAQHPVTTADGAPQLLLPGAFALNIAALLSIGMIAAGAGAVLGKACGDIFFVPLLLLTSYIWARLAARNGRRSANIPSVRHVAPAVALALALALAFILASGAIGSYLTYGASATIYQPVQVAAERGSLHSVTFRSPALDGRMRRFMIYLPPSYANAPTQRYPVIYLLHGAPGGMSNWIGGAHADMTVNDLVSTGKIRDVILVLPDGNGPIYKSSEWANSRDGRQRMEDFIARDLVRFVDAHYRTIASPAGRTLAGLSDGGFGATNIALHHPDVFGSVLTLGGFYRADKSPAFGSGPLDDVTHQYNSPAVYVTTAQGLAAARMIHFIVGVATHDRGYYATGIAFYKELKQLDAHVNLISVNGDHSWRTWGMQFAEALPQLEPPTIVASRLPGR